MLYRKSNQWELCPYKVRYIQHGKEIEQYTHDKQWWLEFEKKWKHTKIIEFIDVDYSNGEISRLEEIKHIPDGYGSICADYVKTGKFPGELKEDGSDWENHPLQLLQLRKENERQGVELSEREINEIMQGIEISEMQIQLLELKNRE